MTFREFIFCNADQVEIMVGIDTKTGRIIDMYCYADKQPLFENPETGNELKTVILADRQNPLFATIKNKALTLKRMVIGGEYLPLLDTEDKDYDNEVAIIQRCFYKYKINAHHNTLSY